MRIHDDPRRYIIKAQDLAPDHSRLYWQQYIYAVVTGVFLITGPILLTFGVIKFISDSRPYVAAAEIVIYLVVMTLAVSKPIPLRFRKPLLIYALVGMSVLLTITAGPYRSGIAFVLLACALAGLLMSLHEILRLLVINLLISLVISWAVLSGRLEGYPVHQVYESWGIIVASTSVIGGVITLIVYTTMKGLHEQSSIIHAQIQDISSIFDSIMDAVFVIDSTGTIEQHNKQASLMCSLCHKQDTQDPQASVQSPQSDPRSRPATQDPQASVQPPSLGHQNHQMDSKSAQVDPQSHLEGQSWRRLVGSPIGELFDLYDPETGKLYRGAYGVGVAGLVLDAMHSSKDLITFQGVIPRSGSSIQEMATQSPMMPAEVYWLNKCFVSCTVKRVVNNLDTPVIQGIPWRDRVVMICRDVTEQVQDQATKLHRERMQSMGNLAGGIAHDFNNSLMGIIGYSELLEQELDDLCQVVHSNEKVKGDGADVTSEPETESEVSVVVDGVVGARDRAAAHVANRSDVEDVIEQVKRLKVLQGYVQEIKTASTGAAGLVKQVQMRSRMDESSIELIDVHVSIRDTVRLLARTVDRSIVIVHELKASEHWTKGNPNMIGSALLNLGINARDAMPTGGHLSITTKVVDITEQMQFDGFLVNQPLRPGPHVCVIFKDTGVGIDADLMPKVFDPFFTTKTRGKGTGFGLPSVLSAIERSKGFLVVRSWVGIGTEFSLYFPLVPDSDKPLSEHTSGHTSGHKGRDLSQDLSEPASTEHRSHDHGDEEEFLSDKVIKNINTLPGVRVTRRPDDDLEAAASPADGASPADLRGAESTANAGGEGGSSDEKSMKDRRGGGVGVGQKKFRGVCLVADDERQVRESISRTLRSWGVKVFSAEDGYVALSQFSGHRNEIELVLLDVNMPNMDGERTLRKFKAIDGGVRVIVITGFAEEEKLKRMMHDQAVIGVLRKPFTQAQLYDAVSLVLARST